MVLMYRLPPRLTAAGRILFVALLALVLTVQPAAAADFRSGSEVLVAQGEILNDDLYASAGNVIINGTVNGDVWVAGGNIQVNGTVNGTVHAIGGSITIVGTVRDSLLVAGGQVSLTGSVGTDALIAAGNLSLAPSVQVGRDAVVGAGQATVAGTVGRKVQALAGDLSLNAAVQGDVDLVVDKLNIGSTSRITGSLRYHSDKPAMIATGAQVQGPLEQLEPTEFQQSRTPSAGERLGSMALERLRGLVTPLALGFLLLTVFPLSAAAVTETLRRSPWYSLAWGIGFSVVVPVLALLITVTGIFVGGFRLGLVLLALYWIIVSAAWVFVGLLVGERLMALLWPQAGSRPRTALALGVVALALVSFLPYVDVLFAVVGTIIGTGALVLWAITTYRSSHQVIAA